MLPIITTKERASLYPCSRTSISSGKGVRWKVDICTNLPTNRQQFLRIDAIKIELFAFMTKHITHKVAINNAPIKMSDEA